MAWAFSNGAAGFEIGRDPRGAGTYGSRSARAHRDRRRGAGPWARVFDAGICVSVSTPLRRTQRSGKQGSLAVVAHAGRHDVGVVDRGSSNPNVPASHGGKRQTCRHITIWRPPIYDAYIVAAGIRDDSKAPLFRSAVGRRGVLTETPMHRVDAWRMVQRRAADLGTHVRIGCHRFRATGITAYLEAGGTLENAQAMAAHESPRTTKLFDRTGDEITLDEVERIAI